MSYTIIVKKDGVLIDNLISTFSSRKKAMNYVYDVLTTYDLRPENVVFSPEEVRKRIKWRAFEQENDLTSNSIMIIKNKLFFPNSVEVLIVALKGNVLTTEIDRRKAKKYQPLLNRINFHFHPRTGWL